jgi:hypothetical protein
MRSKILQKRQMASYIGAGAVVLPSAPANTALPAITGTAQMGATLTATNGTWTGTPAATFTRQWKASGVNIAGATATTLVLTEDQLGAVITVTVTGTNSAGNSAATSAPTSAVIVAGG